jgi:hypothetical protein
MTRRYSVYLGLIALLAVVNFGRWWLHSGSADVSAREKVMLPEDFRVRVNFPAAGGEMRRNLFQPGGGTPVATANVRKTTVRSVTPPPAAPAPNEAEVAYSRLGKLKLLGVVFRNGKGQVYLAQDKESVIALVGDTVFGQFAIDKVTVEAVELRDVQTNTSRRIPVSGK